MYNPIDVILQQLCLQTGIDEVTLKLAICLFISFPFNAFLKRLPDEKVSLKCWFIILISVFYLFGILNIFDGCLTLLISSLFTYGITKFYRSQFMPYVNFIVVMGHLALNHIHGQFFRTYDATKIDITGAQMVLVMKLTAFGWSYYDGSIANEKDLSEYQKSRAIKKHPSLLKFIAYTFFYPSLLTGPSFDFADFDSWLNCEIFRDLPESKKPKHRWTNKGLNKRRQIPKCGKLALWKVIQGIIWIILSFTLPNYISLDYIFTLEFKNKSFFYKSHYLVILSFIFRLKYYAAWTISEASCMVCGLSYNGFDKKTQKIKWNRVQNIDIWRFELAQNSHETLEAWNMNTNKWLKHYVYLRVARKGSKPSFRSTLFTFITSAFWHGTRPGYYLSFATGALFQTCGKIFRRNIRPIFLSSDGKTPLKYKLFYDLICFYVTKLSFGYLVHPFIILDWSKSIYCWGTVYFYIHICVFITLFLFKGPFSRLLITYLKVMQPLESVSKDPITSNNAVIDTSPLGGILKEKYDFELEELKEDMQLGIPAADSVQLDDFKKSFQEFRKEYEIWKNEKGLEIEEENLRRAYENFTTEFKNNATRRISFSMYSSKEPNKM